MRGSNAFEDYVSTYSAEVQRIARQVRSIVMSVLPNATETFNPSAKLVGYGFGTGYKDTICAIILSKGGVKLGIARATELPDPEHLLAGAGKVHKHIAFAPDKAADTTAVRAILKSALSAWKSRQPKA